MSEAPKNVYRCRFIVPKGRDEWTDVVHEGDWSAAAVQFHYDHDHIGLRTVRENGGPREVVIFARVEVEGHDSVITRVFRSGIWRRGGVKPDYAAQLREIARKLEWTGEARELLEDGWEGEEPYAG